jgi:cytoskeletal protein CcmA (bactofilin family)
VRGKVSGSITAKQVRLYGACHVDGDITHEQLAMETGAFFQGRSLRLQRPAQPAAVSAPKSEPVAAPRENGSGALNAKTAPSATA